MDEVDEVQGKYFSITDPKDINTVIYQINKTEKEFLKTSPKYTVERLDCAVEYIGDKKKRTFFVDNPLPTGNHLVIFSFGKERVVVNTGFLDYDQIKISKKLYPTDRYGFIQTSKSTKLKTNFTGNGYSGYIELYPKAYFSNQRIQKIQLEKEKLLRRANKKSILTAIF